MNSRDELSKYLPKHKSDYENTQYLISLGYPIIEPILPELLEWVQDINWPVARLLAPFLISIGANLKPYIIPILHGNDSVWKYWIISSILSPMSEKELIEFKDPLVDVINNLSESDKLEEVDLAINEILLNRISI